MHFATNTLLLSIARISLTLSLATGSAYADEKPIGFVKTAVAEASVTTGTNEVIAVPGTPVHLGDILRTGKAGSMGVTFHDDTIMSIGPKTELVVDEYLYAPSQNSLKLVAKLAHGTLNYISGVIAKLQPESVLIKTPTGTIGVRGTHFVARVEESK